MPIKYKDKDGKDVEFDPTAFATEITTKMNDEINKAVNGATKGLKTDFQKMMDDLGTKLKPVEPPVPTPNPTPNPTPEPAPIGESTPKSIAELNAKLLGLEKVLKQTTTDLETERKAKGEAEQRNKEISRVSTFDNAIAEFQFATPKAKQQFRDAYLGKVEYAEDGSLVVKVGDKPLEVSAFLKNEYEESTHLQPVVNRGGAGATNGVRLPGAGTFKYDQNMSPAQLAALPKEQQDLYRAELAQAITAGGH